MALRIAGSTLEGLFIRALKVDGALAERLKETGFDKDRLEGSYSLDVWTNCLEVARKHLYPKAPKDRGEFQLGEQMVDGFLDTLVGKVVGATLRFLGPEPLCRRLPRFFKAGLEGDEDAVDMRQQGERHFQMLLKGKTLLPWFTAGSIHNALARTGVKPDVRVVDVTPTSAVIDIVW